MVQIKISFSKNAITSGVLVDVAYEWLLLSREIESRLIEFRAVRNKSGLDFRDCHEMMEISIRT